MAEEKKGNLADLKSRLKKAGGGAATGAPIVPEKTATPAPFPVVAEPNGEANGEAEVAAPPVAAPPVVAAPPGLNLPPVVAPPSVGAPPILPPVVALPGLELPPPPKPVESVAAPKPVYREPDPIYIDPDAGNFKLEDDEANRDLDIGKSLGWAKLALPSAAVGLALGLFIGLGSFERTFNAGRSTQVLQFKEPFDKLTGTMDALTKRILDIKDGEKSVDVKLPDDITAITEGMSLLSADSLKQYNATFLRADTLALLMQYRYLTDTFYKTLILHKKKVENTKDDLLKASQGALTQPKYMVVLLDQTDSGGIVSGTVCTTRTEPKTATREEEITDPDDPSKPPTKAMLTYKTYTLQAAFETKPFERETLVKDDKSESVREIINPELIPDYSTQLMADYQERVKNLKTLAKQVQTLQAQVKTALDADVARSISF